MKKVLCPSCSTVFEVDDKVEVDAKCPSCKLNFPIIEGVKALERSYTSLVKKGFRAYTILEFEKSNSYYEEALNINKNDFDVLTRYILNLIYLNTYVSTNYDKVIPLFEEHEIVLNSKNTYLFLAFLKDFVQNVYIYFKELDERIIIDGSFINKKYVEPFFLALKALKEDFDYFDNVLTLLKEEDKNVYLEDNPSFMERYEKYKNKVNEYLSSTFNLINVGDFIFEDGKIDYLNTNIKKGEFKEAKEERVIVANKKFKHEMMALYIISASLIVIGIILVAIGFALNNEIVKYCAFIPFGILVIYMIYFYIKISKK